MGQSKYSIQDRFSASIIGNISKSGLSFVTAMLLAKWLGPYDYGRMVFLLGSFAAFQQLIDMASSSAFFTFISQRPRSMKFIKYFWIWVLFQFLLCLLLLVLILPNSIIETIWKGEKSELVILAMVASFMQNHVWNIASQMAEAQRETVKLQKLTVIVFVIHLLAVVCLWVFGKLILPIIFFTLIIEWAIASFLIINVYNLGDNITSQNKKETASSIFKEFWIYCLPFIPYAWLSFAHDFGDFWMLQHWGGSKQQAYYSVANQIAAVSLLATTSILRIFWKEIAEANHRGDIQKVRFLYKKVTRILYTIGAILAGGLLPWSDEIIHLLLGSAYLGATLTFSIMIFYPVHQSLGQINGTMLFATEKSKTQVIIGMCFMASSIVVTYLVLAPKTLLIPGLNLGSNGLAIKMVFMQLIVVNVMGYVVARYIGSNFDWVYQLVGLLTAIILGLISKLIITLFIPAHFFIQMILFSFLYMFFVLLIIYLMPWLIDVKRSEIIDNSKIILKMVKNII